MNEAAIDGDAAGGSVISQEQVAPIHEQMPEKFRVFDGENFNLESSTSKLIDSYSYLEKRVGSAEPPPETPEGYTLNGENFGENFDAESFMKDESTQGFLKRMHAKGATNAIIQEAIEYGLNEFAPQLQQGNAELSQEECLTSLKEHWQDDASFNENRGLANKAYMALPDELKEAVNSGLGNDPAFMRVMAHLGKGMLEDTPPSEVVQATGDEIQSLMTSEAYRDSKHPEHAAVSKKVQAFFQAKNK